MITRRTTLRLAATAAVLPLLHRTSPAAGPELSDDGLYVQPWFQQSFLDLREDLAEAQGAGKRLVVFWEQRGCPYCREMHAVNLADPEIAGILKTHFLALQLNFYGARPVTDLDGEQFEERRLAQRWRVNFTPTLCFFPPSIAETRAKSGPEAEAWRLQGYWKPFHFQATLVYVMEQGYKSQPFQPWLATYADRLRAQGKEVKLW